MRLGNPYLPPLLLVLVLAYHPLSAQSKASGEETRKALNSYIDFANESLHMLSAIHLRLETYNAQSNQYVSGNRENGLEFRIDDLVQDYNYFGLLQGVCLRAKGVANQSVNLRVLYEETRVRELQIPAADRKKLNAVRDRMWSLMGELLEYCEDLTQYTSQQRYLKEPDLAASYEILNRSSQLYEKFHMQKDYMSDVIGAISNYRPSALSDLQLILNQSQHLLRLVRMGERELVKHAITRLEQAVMKAESQKAERLTDLEQLGLYYDKGMIVYKHIFSYARQIVRWSKMYINQGPISPMYRSYPRDYYYYNERLLACYNHHKYGLVAYYNQFLGFAKTTLVKQIEETPRFLVIDPPLYATAENGEEGQPTVPDLEDAAINHLIFLLDVSASMKKPEKLPLLKKSIAYMLPAMRPEDRISIITYSGNARVMLSSVPATDQAKIMETLNRLGLRGETNFQKGLKSAYELAQKEYIIHGNNRIILATDGDFIFKSSAVRLAEKYSEKPIFLSVLLFSKFETLLVREQFTRLAVAGNGNYEHVREGNAGQVLVEEAKAVQRK